MGFTFSLTVHLVCSNLVQFIESELYYVNLIVNLIKLDNNQNEIIRNHNSYLNIYLAHPFGPVPFRDINFHFIEINCNCLSWLWQSIMYIVAYIHVQRRRLLGYDDRDSISVKWFRSHWGRQDMMTSSSRLSYWFTLS